MTKGTLENDVVVDAVRMRLLEIGEAVTCLDDSVLATEPDIPWKQIARMRDHLAHRYFLSSTDIIAETVKTDLGPLLAAVRRLRDKVDA
nr:HepT-like ribonuclease domain-containing protein [Nocardioides panzhihuensis]